MADFDAQSLAEQAVMIGLITRDQSLEAIRDARDGSVEELGRVLTRKQFLTSWQFDRLKKGETQGFFFGDCVVMFHLAEGTFARVYRGRKQTGGQSVAVKVLRQRFVSDRDSITRFNKEAEAGLRITHPNIVRIFDYGEQDRRHYMSMEYVEGSNLRDFLKYRNRLRPGEALPLMLGLARGLQFSLSKGVTHRDLKPSNILISSNGIAKLVDFGLATIEGEDKKTGILGQRTVDYSNLERTCGSAKGDPRSDIFFMGCVYYQMISGQNPMPEADSKDLLVKMLKRSINAIKPLSEHHHAPPEGLSRIVEMMMRVELKSRYQTMDAVVADLEAFQAEASSKQLAAAPSPAAEGELDVSMGFAADDDEGQPRPKDVLCVEGQEAVREAMSKSLQGMGYRVQVASDPETATRQLREYSPDAILFDADGIGSNGIERFLRFREAVLDAGQNPIILVLIGPRHRGLAASLPVAARLLVLSKPLKLKEIQEALIRLVPVG